MNIVLNSKARLDLFKLKLDKDFLMEELGKGITYDKSKKLEDILLVLDVGEQKIVVIGKRYRNTITLIGIKSNPIIAK